MSPDAGGASTSKSANKKKRKSKKKASDIVAPNGVAETNVVNDEVVGDASNAAEEDEDETADTDIVNNAIVGEDANVDDKNEDNDKAAEATEGADTKIVNNGVVGEDPNAVEEVEGEENRPSPDGRLQKIPYENASVVGVKAQTIVREENQQEKDDATDVSSSNGHPRTKNMSNPRNSDTHDVEDDDTAARLEAMARDRDSLRVQVTELRKSLESIQGQHQEELSGLREEADEAQSSKERAEEQYRTLLGKVNTIRSQLGERLKADAEELSQARTQIEELQEQNRSLQDGNTDTQATISKLTADSKAQADEVASLRSRSNLSTTNWVKERDDLNTQLAFAREEFENAKQAMQDWEVLAMEERSTREALAERTGEIEEQLGSLREDYERVLSERDGQNSTVDGLQRALHDIQEARRQELREMVESSTAQLDSLRKQADNSAQQASTSASQLEAAQKELERYMPFEKEVKEKNLLIGKLRHEAVILNDHLTKALRFLKRGKPEDNVDRQVMTTYLLHFLALDRSDPKRFQILQLIAALLGWTEEQREQAGLSRPGASISQLRVPLSPFRRTPSTPALSSDLVTSPGGSSRDSLAELWSDFLEREAEEGGRRGSMAPPGQRSASVTSPPPRPDSSGLGIRAVSVGNQNPPQENR